MRRVEKAKREIFKNKYSSEDEDDSLSCKLRKQDKLLL